MAVVDYAFYSTVYAGSEVDETSLPAFCSRATDIVAAMTRYAVTESNMERFPALIQTLYKKAICAEIDYLSINGADAVTAGGNAGFTVGKVTVHGSAATGSTGAMAANIAPLALQYLEQTGLMHPSVPTVDWW